MTQRAEPRRRRFDRDVDGILLLDKPVGRSSNAALQQARSLFGARKAGHAGSLDPLASGLLPVCFGQATKVCGRLLDANKTYRVRIALGARTESGDCETPVIERAPVPPLEPQAVDAVLETFLGEQTQVPPMHSALKHEGKRLYELARRGESVERPPRRIVIYSLERLAPLGGDPTLEVRVRCSKGTYIRSLAEDIAERLGTLGHVVALRRLGIDPFDDRPMYTLEALEDRLATEGQAALEALLLSPDTVFADLPAVRLDPRAERLLLHGQTVRPSERVAPGAMRAYDTKGRFLGLVEGRPDGQVRPQRLFVTPP